MHILVIGGLGCIGSVVIEHLLKLDHKITAIDLNWFQGIVPNNINFINSDIKNTNLNWNQWDCILYFAGHSSVAMCNEDINGSYINNVDNFRFVLSNLPKNTPFIYASSSSVYGGSLGKICKETDYFPPTDQYSLTKIIRDQLALVSNKKTFGLRFGTICGYSPNPRPELLINLMTLNAIETNKITVTNPDSQRPALGTKDLVRAIENIINKPDATSGVYNLASTHGTILDTAKAVCSIVKCDLNILGNTGGYSFDISTEKFEKEFDFTFKQDLTDIINDVIINSKIFKNSKARKGIIYEVK